MARLLKNLLILVLAGILLALALAALVLFVPPAFRLGLELAGSFLPFHVEMDSFRHVPGNLTLEGVRVSTSSGSFCEIARLEASYSLRKLLAGKIEFTRIHLANPRLDARALVSGGLSQSVPSQGKIQEEQQGSQKWVEPALLAPFRLQIEELAVQGAEIRYSDPTTGVALALESADLNCRLTTHPVSSADLELTQGTFRIGTETPLDMEMKGRATFQEGLVKIHELSISGPQTMLRLCGEYGLASQEGRAEAEMEDVPLAAILEACGIGGVPFQTVSGTLGCAYKGLEQTVDLNGSLIPVLLGQEIRLNLTGRFQDGRLVLDSVQAAHDEATLKGQANWTLSSGDLAGDYRIEAARLDTLLTAFGLEGMRFLGLSIAGDLGGKIQEPLFRFQASAREFAYQEPILQGLSLQGEYSTRGEVTLDGKADRLPLLQGVVQGSRFHLHLADRQMEGSMEAGSSLQVRAMWNPPGQHAEGEFNVRRLSMAPLLLRQLPTISRCRISSKGSFQGDPARKETWAGKMQVEEFDLASPELKIRTQGPCLLSLAQGQVEGSVSLSVNQGHVRASGRYPILLPGHAAVRADASLLLEPLEPILRKFVPVVQESKGNLRIQGSLDGPRNNLRTTARIEVSDGSIRLAPKAAGEEGEGPPPQDVLKGRIALSADIDGPVLSPQGAATVEMTGATLYGVPVETLRLQGESDAKKFWVREARLSNAQGSILFTGQGDWKTGAISGEVKSTIWSLQQALSGLGVPATGKVELDGRIQGTFRAPQANVRVRAKELAIQGKPIPDLESEVSYRSGMLELASRMSGGSLEAKVRLSDSSRPFTAVFSLEEMQLEPFLSLIKGMEAKGKVSVSGEIAGPLADLDKWKGHVLCKELALETANVPFSLSRPVEVSIEEGSLFIPEAVVGFEQGEVQIRGRLGRECNMALQGKVPLQPVASFIPWFRFGSGGADLDIRMTGPLASPRLEGSANLAADRVSIQGYDYPFDHVEALLRGSPEGILLESFVARTGDGEIRATGRSSMVPFSVESLDAQIISLPARLSEDLLGRISGNLSFKGNAQSSRLGGRIRILEARYSRDFQVVGAVLKPTRPSPVSVRKPSAFLSNMKLDFHIASGPDLFVENNVARIILSMDMDFQGTAAVPVPLGKVEVVEGKLSLLKKRFVISEGSLSFLDPTAINPMLHVESRVEVRGASRDYVVYLSLAGPLDKIELDLRSIPDLVREDILFVLVTGKTQAEYLDSGPGDSKSGATQLAASGISLLFGEGIRRRTGLDVFEMEAGEGEAPGLKTTVGKRVNERVELRGIVAIGSSHQASEAQVEYRLTDTIFLVGTQRTDGSFGLDVRLRFFSK